jgi:hypothetical protein
LYRANDESGLKLNCFNNKVTIDSTLTQSGCNVKYFTDPEKLVLECSGLSSEFGGLINGGFDTFGNQSFT